MAQKKLFMELEFKDAFMFAATLEDEELCRDVLERILEIPIRSVKVHKESLIQINPEYRGIRMDVFADDSEGTIFDVEMQTTNRGNLPKRSRCYQSQMDVAVLKPGEDFHKLPESFVIFICTFDPFGRGRYRYTYQSICKEDGEALDDGVCKVFLSTCGTKEAEVSPELVSFLHFVEKSSGEAPEGSDPMLDRLRNRIAYLKHSRRLEERYMLFGEMLDDERAAGRMEGHREGHMEGHREGRMEGRCEGIEEGLALIEAMLADHKEADIPRIRKDSVFRMEMAEYYHIAESQKQI